MALPRYFKPADGIAICALSGYCYSELRSYGSEKYSVAIVRHENILHEIFFTRKFPDLRYVRCTYRCMNTRVNTKLQSKWDILQGRVEAAAGSTSWDQWV